MATRAFRCEHCDKHPIWRIVRRGDAAVTWACDTHLARICHDLQRPNETTELVVTRLTGDI